MINPKKFIVTVIFFIFLCIANSNAEIISDIKINGNSRISNDSILSFLPVKIDDNINAKDINNITKKLYETNFFNNLDIEFLNNVLIINVIENPIIQNVIYNGIKSDNLKQFITEDVKLIDRSSFVQVYAEQDLITIKENLKKKGYYFPKIKSKIEDLSNNRINLIYEIELGKKAKIKKILFIGDKKFKDRKLRSVILSEEYKLWKFISGKKFLNEEIVDFDLRLLRSFYLNKGFYNVKISSTFAKLIHEDEFELIFNINAGEKIYFGDLTINLPLNYNEKNFYKLKKTLNKLKGEYYSINAIEKIIADIDLLALNEQYETIDINITEKLVKNNLNLIFEIKDTQKTMISKINIFGNNVTRENVIRNQFEFDEGDIYNKILLTKTINNIRGLNFFKKVEYDIDQDNISGDKIINIKVEEKPTGEIGASAGVSTSGNSFGLFLRENNYLGKGLGVESNLVFSDNSIKGLLSIKNPNFNDSDKSIYATIESSETDRLTDFGYKTNRMGFSYGTSFEFLDDFNFGIGNKNYYEKIETDDSASNLQKKQEGDYWDSFLNFDFIYDKRNQKFNPSKGFSTFYSIDLPIISETNTLSSSFTYNFFTELFENNITSIVFYNKFSNSLSNDDIKLSERNFLSSKRLRGFETGKIGPKDGDDFIGGNYASSINISTTLPQILEQYQNIDFVYFLDAGNVWGVDYSSSIDDSNKLRSSTGIGIDWATPIGPLNFTFSHPISKADTDITESFRFNIGTTF